MSASYHSHPDLNRELTAIGLSLVASPPKKRKRSWRERLADLLADLKITTSLMFWIPPAYPEPLDDEPYIPFALWDKLSKEGKITRWESNEEYLNRIRKAQQDLVLDLTEDIGI